MNDDIEKAKYISDMKRYLLSGKSMISLEEWRKLNQVTETIESESNYDDYMSYDGLSVADLKRFKEIFKNVKH